MQPKIDNILVQNLIATQIPQWHHFSIKPVIPGGWDNRTFHLGDHMLIRMPSAAKYTSQIKKEFRWLPILAPLLRYQIPTPLVMGKPTKDYPWQWGIYKWLEGTTVSRVPDLDLNQFARDLAAFLNDLQNIDSTGGPLPGKQTFHRGESLRFYDAEVHQAITILKDKIDSVAITEMWQAALATKWHHLPVWVHGDIAAENLLVHNGTLNAVIDFGGLAIGDPACDLAIAWTLFKNESRKIFRNSLSLDEATWQRGRAWALWKALIIAAGITQTNAIEGKQYWHIINETVADHNQNG